MQLQKKRLACPKLYNFSQVMVRVVEENPKKYTSPANSAVDYGIVCVWDIIMLFQCGLVLVLFHSEDLDGGEVYGPNVNTDLNDVNSLFVEFLYREVDVTPSLYLFSCWKEKKV